MRGIDFFQVAYYIFFMEGEQVDAWGRVNDS